MKKYNFSILLIFISLLLCNSCVDEERLDNRSNIEEGIPTTATLSFAAEKAPEIETKSALTEREEYKVDNLTVFVFKMKGDEWKLEKSIAFSYDQIQDKTERNDQLNALTTGKISFEITSGLKRIYAIVNAVDNGLGTIVPNYSTIKSINELESLVFAMNTQEIFRRNGKLLMSGFYSAQSSDQPDGQVGIKSDGTFDRQGNISLSHVDSRITFKVTTAPGITFTSDKWKVYNVPVGSRVFESQADINPHCSFILLNHLI